MYDEPLVVLVPAGHPWAGRDDVSPAELDDQELLMLDEGNCLRDQTLALCQRYGVNPPIAVATTLATVVGMVTHGVGATVIPEGALRLLGHDGAFAVARFAEPGAVRRIGLVHRTSSSRGEDFARLAEVVTDLARAAGLPVRPLSESVDTDVRVGRRARRGRS